MIEVREQQVACLDRPAQLGQRPERRADEQAPGPAGLVGDRDQFVVRPVQVAFDPVGEPREHQPPLVVVAEPGDAIPPAPRLDQLPGIVVAVAPRAGARAPAEPVVLDRQAAGLDIDEPVIGVVAVPTGHNRLLLSPGRLDLDAVVLGVIAVAPVRPGAGVVHGDHAAERVVSVAPVPVGRELTGRPVAVGPLEQDLPAAQHLAPQRAGVHRVGAGAFHHPVGKTHRLRPPGVVVVVPCDHLVTEGDCGGPTAGVPAVADRAAAAGQRHARQPPGLVELEPQLDRGAVDRLPDADEASRPVVVVACRHRAGAGLDDPSVGVVAEDARPGVAVPDHGDPPGRVVAEPPPHAAVIDAGEAVVVGVGVARRAAGPLDADEPAQVVVGVTSAGASGLHDRHQVAAAVESVSRTAGAGLVHDRDPRRG